MASVTRLRPTCPCGCGGVGGCQADPCQPSRPQMPMGVTDGSNALPGQVGEWFTAQATVAYQSGVPLATSIAVGTLPAGDWDVWSFMAINPTTAGAPFLDSVDYWLDPLPAGFSQPLGQAWMTTDPAAAADVVLVSGVGRANTTVPTALVFKVNINSTQGTGSVTIIVNGRRMR